LEYLLWFNRFDWREDRARSYHLFRGV